MSRLLEFLLGSLLITVFTVAAMFFFALHYLLRVGGIADCVWQASAKAWIDSNANGRIDPGEPPLRNVEIHVDDLHNQQVDVSWPTVTGQDGVVRLLSSVPGCAETVFELYPEVPEGYRITTKPRIEVRSQLWDNPGAEPVYLFGFTSEH